MNTEHMVENLSKDRLVIWLKIAYRDGMVAGLIREPKSEKEIEEYAKHYIDNYL